MSIPEFMRFYGYTLSEAMQEYAISFFTLINSMYRLSARESLNAITVAGTAMGGDDSDLVIKGYQKQERGLHGLVQEVRVAKRAKR